MSRGRTGMSGNRLRELVGEAAEIVAGIPEPLQQVAFGKVLDILLGGVRSAPAGRAPARPADNTSKSRQEPPDQQVGDLLRQMDSTQYPQIADGQKALDL